MTKLLAMMIILSLLSAASPLMAGGTPQEQRQELMEQSKDAAKTIGGMLKGQVPFSADAAMTSFKAWSKVASQFGELFPEGTETGHDTEAKAEIWTDRAGFDKQLAMFSEAADAAVAANPQSLEEMQAVAGPIFDSCKGCHEDYRVKKD